MRVAVVLFSLCFAISPSFAMAEQLLVRDCVGQVRWVEDLESGKVVTLEALSVSKPSNLEARLVRERDGAVVEGAPSASGVSFDGVTAGDWRLCASPTQVVFSDFRLGQGEVTSASTLRTVAVGVAGVGTAIAFMALGSGDSSGGGAAASGPLPLGGALPAQAGSGTPGTIQTAANTQGPDVTAAARPRKRGLNCFIDEPVDPISPLS